MSKFLSKHGSWVLTLALGLAILLFWWLCYPAALAYQEQLQLFLWTDDYLYNRLAEPGGAARYLSELLIQFYNIIVVGALILAVLYMVLHRLSFGFLRKERYLMGLSLVPPLLLWYVMGGENVMLTYGVALLMVMAATLLLNRIRTPNIYCWWAVAILSLPLLYWLTGPMALVTALCLNTRHTAGKWIKVGITATATMMVVLCILLSAQWLPFPIERLWMGLNYYRYVQPLPTIMIAIPFIVVLLFHLPGLLEPLLQNKGRQQVALIAGFAVPAAIAALVPISYEERTYDLMEYDYLVRTGNWNAIIRKSEQKQPDLPMSVCATNLALAMTNQLCERGFQFFQHGSDGLLPPFERNFSTQQLTGEAYFQLGLINTAQRFAFEAMEALPNYNKSGRVIKRLAETNLVNGQYEVARKYLHLLRKTIFYRKWAQRTEALLGQEEKINSHPLYGRLRRNSMPDDLLFSERELDKICGRLFLHNPQNQMAMQYLLMFPLLQKDMNTFMQYMQVVQPRIPFNPRVCQEGVAFAFMMKHQPLPKGMVSPMVERDFSEFGSIYNNEGKSSPRLERFSHTLWYYLTQ